MAVTVDVYGSRVSNDLFRHISIGKYKYNRCFTHVPITTLYEKSFNFQKKNIDDMDLDDYEKTMFRVQVSKTLPQILKKNKSDILIIDLADELMERCELKSETTGQIAVISCNEELCKQFIFNESEYSLTRTYEPFDIEFGLVEEKYKKFASDILYSDSNPNGYHPEQIIIIEALYSADIMKNDGNVHPHDKIYKIKESNEWLRKLYAILRKYFVGCQVIKMPDFTHSTQNHLNGVHPLHYMADTYYYFERVLDVMCGYSYVNTPENLWKEQSLKNRLETRIAHSSIIYRLDNQIRKLQKRVDELKSNIK